MGCNSHILHASSYFVNILLLLFLIKQYWTLSKSKLKYSDPTPHILYCLFYTYFLLWASLDQKLLHDFSPNFTVKHSTPKITNVQFNIPGNCILWKVPGQKCWNGLVRCHHTMACKTNTDKMGEGLHIYSLEVWLFLPVEVSDLDEKPGVAAAIETFF